MIAIKQISRHKMALVAISILVVFSLTIVAPASATTYVEEESMQLWWGSGWGKITVNVYQGSNGINYMTVKYEWSVSGLAKVRLMLTTPDGLSIDQTVWTHGWWIFPPYGGSGTNTYGPMVFNGAGWCVVRIDWGTPNYYDPPNPYGETYPQWPWFMFWYPGSGGPWQ